MWAQDDFIGGHLALDFINTVADTGKSRVHSRVTSEESLGLWWQAAITNMPGRLPHGLTNVNLDEIHALREAAYDVVAGVASDDGPSAKSIQSLRSFTDGAAARADVMWASGALTKAAADGNATDVLSLLIDDFLFGPSVARVTQCGRCTWLYVNQGRGRGRKWCNMRTCGNRAKVEKYRGK